MLPQCRGRAQGSRHGHESRRQDDVLPRGDRGLQGIQRSLCEALRLETGAQLRGRQRPAGRRTLRGGGHGCPLNPWQDCDRKRALTLSELFFSGSTEELVVEDDEEQRDCKADARGAGSFHVDGLSLGELGMAAHIRQDQGDQQQDVHRTVHVVEISPANEADEKNFSGCLLI